jgi:hypothetical protein
MPKQSLWDPIDVELPDLPCILDSLETQGKGSTAWASHSHTPVSISISISRWDDFDACIRVETAKHENTEVLDADVVASLISLRFNFVHKEEDVIDNTVSLLRPLSDLSTFEFIKSDECTILNPDLVAVNRVTGRIGGPSQYSTPKNRSTVRGKQ